MANVLVYKWFSLVTDFNENSNFYKRYKESLESSLNHVLKNILSAVSILLHHRWIFRWF